MSKIYLSASAAMIMALGACGGGGSGSDELSFSEMSNEGERILTKYQDEDWTPVENMPTSGSATYRGVAGFGDEGATSDAETYDEALNNLTVASELTLEADFASAEVSGKFENFRDFENNEIDGEASLANGKITDNYFEAEIDGELRDDGETAQIEGTAFGDFVGEDASMIDGFMGGQLTDDEGSSGFEGLFVAEADD